jgi:hypothetical protein
VTQLKNPSPVSRGGGRRGEKPLSFDLDVNVSSCRTFQSGLKMLDVAEGKYGTHLNIYDWQERRLLQRIDLGNEGTMTFEIRCASLKYKKATYGGFFGALFICSFCRASESTVSVDARTVATLALAVRRPIPSL